MKTSESISALRNVRRVIRNRDRKLAMKQSLDALIAKGGVELGSDMEEEMASIGKSHADIESLPMSDFRRIFWNQQVSQWPFASTPINLYILFDSEHMHA